MTDEKKTPEIIFAPGCFDSFEGTQEELNELMSEIQRMAESGELFENSKALDLDELTEEDPEFAEKLINGLDNINGQGKRTLQ
jgi:hypothetical protein